MKELAEKAPQGSGDAGYGVIINPISSLFSQFFLLFTRFLFFCSEMSLNYKTTKRRNKPNSMPNRQFSTDTIHLRLARYVAPKKNFLYSVPSFEKLLNLCQQMFLSDTQKRKILALNKFSSFNNAACTVRKKSEIYI